MKKRGRPRKAEGGGGSNAPGSSADGAMNTGNGTTSGIAAKGDKKRRRSSAHAAANLNSTAGAIHAAQPTAGDKPAASANMMPSYPSMASPASNLTNPTSPNSQWTPLRSPSSPNFPSLPIPSLFNSTSCGLDRLLSAAASVSAIPSSSKVPPSASPPLSTPVGTGKGTANPLPSGPNILPAPQSSAPLPKIIMSKTQVDAPDSSLPIQLDAHVQTSSSEVTPPEKAHPSLPRQIPQSAQQNPSGMAESLLSLLVDEVRELRNSNREIKKEIVQLQLQQGRYEEKQSEIIRRLDMLIAKSEGQNSEHTYKGDGIDHRHKQRQRKPKEGARSINSTLSSSSSPSSGAVTISNSSAVTYSSSSGTASFPEIPVSLTSLSLPAAAAATVGWPMCMYLGTSLPPANTWPRLAASEILSNVPLLSCYDLDGSENPFVVDDFRKPAALCRVTVGHEPPTMVYVNQAFCEATGYASHELVGFPIEKVSLPDFRSKAAVVPYIFATSTSPLSVHIPIRPICVPKDGAFVRVLCRQQILYDEFSKAAWMAICVDGREEGQPVIDLGLHSNQLQESAIEAYIRRFSLPRSFERAREYLGARLHTIVSHLPPAARIASIEATSSPLSDSGTGDEDGDTNGMSMENRFINFILNSSAEASPSGSASSTPITSSLEPSSPALSSIHSPSTSFSGAPPPSPLYPVSPFPASPSMEDFSWLLQSAVRKESS